MKRFKYLNLLLIFLLIVSLSLSACSKKSDESETPAIGEESNEIAEVDDEEVLKEDTSEEESEKKDEVVETDEEEVEEVEEKSHDSPTEGEKETKKEETPEEEPELKEEAEIEGVNILKIEGKVDNPLSLKLDDLKAMGDLIFEGNFYSLNNFGTTQHTKFKGVNLWGLLQKAQITSDAAKVRIVATDGYEMEFTVDEVKRQDYIDETDPNVKLPMIIAWEENGVEYDSEEGPPYKLIIGQKEPGDVNKPQWVSNIDRIIVE